MNLLVCIPIAIVLLAIFWIRNVIIFQKAYCSDPIAALNIQIVQTHNVFYGRLLEISNNFFNYTASLITKFVGFTILSIILYFLCYNDLYGFAIALTSIHVFFLMLTIFVFIKRISFYKSLDSSSLKNAYSPVLRASACLPIYQFLLQLLLIASLFFDY